MGWLGCGRTGEWMGWRLEAGKAEGSKAWRVGALGAGRAGGLVGGGAWKRRELKELEGGRAGR